MLLSIPRTDDETRSVNRSFRIGVTYDQRVRPEFSGGFDDALNKTTEVALGPSNGAPIQNDFQHCTAGHSFASQRQRIFRSDVVQLKRLLIESNKNKVTSGRRFPALAPQQIFEFLLAALDQRKELHAREAVGSKEQSDDECRPGRANNCECNAAMTGDPIHSTTLENRSPAANRKLERKLSC